MRDDSSCHDRLPLVLADDVTDPPVPPSLR
jgi:hypothetical protein